MGSELGVKPHSQSKLNLSPVSIWWAVWACFWTVVVVLGMAYLIVNRSAPTLRVRGIGLSLSAIGFLHLYWISVQFGVMIANLMPGDAEFWIMGIYLSCGMALFHASNTRFLHVAHTQKKYVQNDESVNNEKSTPKAGLIERFRRLDYSTKVLVVVGIGMLFQIFILCLMYIISRKWHRSWGIPGTEVTGPPMQQKMEMGRGWEWWPTVAWQFFWAWIVAPIILWKSRHIHDTQGWRVQTIGCAVANLHATPMWLVGIYVPAMEKVNKYWLPPQWICLSIWFMEIFTILLPCWEVVRHQSLIRETLDAITQWEKKTKASGSEAKSINSVPTMVDSIMSGWKSTDGSVKTNSSDDSILTMSALNYVLERNPTPLLEFSALHDFSAENIAFLTSVAEWKSSLPTGAGEHLKELIRERFNRALHIYAQFISIRDAKLPINIASQTFRRLEAVFESSARILYGEKREVDQITPFDKPRTANSSDGSEIAMQTSIKSSTLGDRVQYWGDIPDEFDETIFDEAEKEIKYLVLTNTWPKFVRSSRISRTRKSNDTLC